MHITLFNFYHGVIERARDTGESFGQSLFGHLSFVRPEMAKEIRGTDKDPSNMPEIQDPRWGYDNLTDSSFVKFIDYIEKNW